MEINICDNVTYQECFASFKLLLFEWTSNAQGTSSNQQTKTSWEATSHVNPNLRKYTLVIFLLSPRNDATEWIMLILIGSRVAKQQGRERCGFWRDAAAIPMRMMRFSPLVAHFIRRRNSAKRSSLETSSKLAIASLALSLDCSCSLRKKIKSKAWMLLPPFPLLGLYSSCSRNNLFAVFPLAFPTWELGTNHGVPITQISTTYNKICKGCMVKVHGRQCHRHWTLFKSSWPLTAACWNKGAY